MRKIFVFCVSLIVAMSIFADDVRRVAILETVDRVGNVPYGAKLMLRANLAKAITNTPGYEAYDRSDMDAIMGEQNFQRTGMVSNDQIKRLGEMTGAKYILVAEAAVVDASNMYITAKLLDVETARTVMTDNQLMGTSAQEIQQGSQHLAELLINPVDTGTRSNKSSSMVISNTNPNSAQNYDYRYNSDYNKAIKLRNTGCYLLATSAVFCLPIGIPCLAASVRRDHGYTMYNYSAYAAGWTFIGIGLGTFVASIPMICIGVNRSYKIQNSYLSLNVGANNIGLRLTF